MSIENKVGIITDTGSSIRPDSQKVQELDISVVPLDIKFFENGQWISMPDTNISPNEFYTKMRSSDRLPQTSGAITGRINNLYQEIGQRHSSIISIHVTSQHSAVWESAVLGSKLALEKNPHLLIEVVDSKQVSLGIWFLVEYAAQLANEGYPLEDIKRLVLETIPKTELYVSLSTLENIVKGGRLPSTAGYLGSKLHLKPIIGLENGKLKIQNITRTNQNAQKELIKRVENTNRDITKLAIIHTNYPEGAEILRQNLAPIYSSNIRIFEAGPVLGVHAGEKAVGIAIQKA
ncbi:MAG TPA: DegV family protein [Spirochaetia bacterium]|nr:DegV family protein [Spirochaetia bacterium]